MNKFIAAFALSMCVSAAIASYSDSVQADLSDNLIRLHILAQSDSKADQEIKLKVRDAVLEKAGSELTASDKDTCRQEIIKSLPEIEKTANDVLKENGVSYRARAQYGKFCFPEKSYKTLTLPAGDYWGVRITLGSGEGHNWWCVMYPPLCLGEDGSAVLSESGKELLRVKLDKDTYDIITGEGKEAEVRFKLVEIAQEIKQKLNSR